ncbi:MAG: hypothetical protein HQK54_00880 [Oligoflexales bacterium]|nr:hypothetical protein [Oligoflexales bacterium]
MRLKLSFSAVFVTILFLVFMTSVPGSLPAAIFLDISASDSRTYPELESRKDQYISGSISFGIFDHIRIGYTHLRGFSYKEGYRTGTDSATGTEFYYRFKDNTQTISSSVDLTLILYNGMISPFIFGGLVWKDYYTTVEYPSTIYKAHTKFYKVPNYGCGLSIFLDDNFRLKITQTFTPGEKRQLKDGVETKEDILETYTQVGISYRL